ncbi:hypothetical protein NDU88_003269 [Pleurodeles waltl]|uniref:Uncharacterized protein n=1 Tax=Pleurodeles waltl TaxID=8319 RepID=A0AAV7T5Z6_PLEWA|nr:hypothetical protein NDU88_003269 [Pleurodeles waltl]
MECGDPRQKQLSFESAKMAQRQHSLPADTEPLLSGAFSSSIDGTGAIMAELHGGFQAIDSCFDLLANCLDRMTEHLVFFTTRLEGTDHRTSEIEDRNMDALKRLEKVEHMLKAPVAKNKDLKAHLCCNNICIAGIAESTNTGWVDKFMGALLCELFGRSAFTDTFFGGKGPRNTQPLPGAPPTPISLMLPGCKMFHLACEKGPVHYQGATLYFFQDFTQTVQKAHRKLTDVKHILQKQGLKYNMLYPPHLCIEMDGQHQIFPTPGDAIQFCKQHCGKWLPFGYPSGPQQDRSP